MDLNIKQMKELIGLFEGSNLSEISVQQDDFQVTMKKNSAGETRTRSKDLSAGGDGDLEREDEAQEAAASLEPEEREEEKGGDYITSPIVGTFYRSASPEEPPYVEVGDTVQEGDTVCIVEAMKVMNEVKAEKSGTIDDICVEDGDSVEYGQKLFEITVPDKGS